MTVSYCCTLLQCNLRKQQQEKKSNKKEKPSTATTTTTDCNNLQNPKILNNKKQKEKKIKTGEQNSSPVNVFLLLPPPLSEITETVIEWTKYQQIKLITNDTLNYSSTSSSSSLFTHPSLQSSKLANLQRHFPQWNRN